ncbi:glycosyl transferase [Azospirillum sp. TSH100]|uniref:glycosyltransferase family 2 protein n=1 Tax=Azospirillum sp. TSH100 TaxID=652764 RepID=UPI000D610852|nr:glycosyltransferase family 2 protein [Azospirillum sp. TSH100]PWC84436.1 glycosyl transferase [Azospirillum sp. TSH100]QCG87655.1 glycosyltransferase [Azospirillum sp. TSH100]
MTVSTIDRPALTPAADASGTPSVAAEAGPAPTIAVLIPCYNEEAAIGKVVQDFRAALPDAVVYVYDNNSKDRTVEVAQAAGAVVRREPLQGKGNVMRRMFADIEADVYVLVDGDDTYHAPSAPELVKRLWDEQLDMVNGARVTEIVAAYRPGHRFGNLVLTGMVAKIFGSRIGDMLSGYRVFSRRFVKSFPALASGFETETELTVHALELRMPIAEVKTPYKDRPPGSHSKLNTIRDGIRILRTIIILVKEERPLPFFSAAFGLLALLSVILGVPVIATYFQTGLVPRFPTALLATGLMLLAFLSLTCGLILDTVTHGRREAKRMSYLSLRAPGNHRPLAADRGAGTCEDGRR